MAQINKPNTFSANTTISSSEVNDNFDTIYDEFNGNINAANLASNAVTTAKITDSNVTTPKIADSNVTTAKINDDAVTPPKWTNPYKFSAYAGGTTSLGSTAWTQIAYSTEEYDSNNNFASNTYTAPVNGFYHFEACGTVATTSRGANEAFGIGFFKGGVEYKRGQYLTESSASIEAGRTVSMDIQLTAGDTIDVRIFNNTAGTRTALAGQKYSFFSGYLISET